MRVEPELLDHPKFLRLERHLGDVAAKVLLRLWGHCQNSQRGGVWKGADSEYVEIVCRWTGKAGSLFGALRSCRFVDKVNGAIVIHDWDTFNSKARSAWFNGLKGGRPLVNRTITQGEPRCNPTITQVKPNDNPQGLGFDGGKPTANQRVSESVSESVSECKGKEGEAAPGADGETKRRCQEMFLLKTKHAAMNEEVKELRDQVRAGEIGAEGAKRLSVLEGALKKVRKKQASI